VGQVNNVLCYFQKQRSAVKYRLFQAYCYMSKNFAWYTEDEDRAITAAFITRSLSLASTCADLINFVVCSICLLYFCMYVRM